VATDVAIGTPPPRQDVTASLWAALSARNPASPARLEGVSVRVTELGRSAAGVLYLVDVTAPGAPPSALDVVVEDAATHPVVDALPGIAG